MVLTNSKVSIAVTVIFSSASTVSLSKAMVTLSSVSLSKSKVVPELSQSSVPLMVNLSASSPVRIRSLVL